MKRTYQLLVVVIIFLFGYLVVDFVRGQAEERVLADNLRRGSIPGRTGTFTVDRKTPDMGKDWDKIFIGANQVIPAATQPVVNKTALKLNSVVIEPGRASKAFILNTTTGQPGIYQENERIRDSEWSVGVIQQESVKVRSDSGEELVLTIDRGSWGSSLFKEAINIVTAIPQGARQTFESLNDMLQIAQVAQPMMDTSVPVESLRPKVLEVIKRLSPQLLDEQLKAMGMERSDLPPESEWQNYGMKLLQIARQEPVPATGNMVQVTFANKVNPDNSPAAPVNTFTSGKYKIYACFQNKDALKGVAKIGVRWLNKTINDEVTMRPYLVDVNAPNNFIWVEPKEGWQKGTYEVDVFKVSNLEKVGSGTYRVE